MSVCVYGCEHVYMFMCTVYACTRVYVRCVCVYADVCV